LFAIDEKTIKELAKRTSTNFIVFCLVKVLLLLVVGCCCLAQLCFWFLVCLFVCFFKTKKKKNIPRTGERTNNSQQPALKLKKEKDEDEDEDEESGEVVKKRRKAWTFVGIDPFVGHSEQLRHNTGRR